MKELPLIVAQTEVGKTVNVKIWRNKRELIKKIKLGRLETSEDFNLKKAEAPKTKRIEKLKIEVRALTNEDINNRNLPEDISGVVITKIDQNSPINYLRVNNIIVEADKKKIKTILLPYRKVQGKKENGIIFDLSLKEKKVNFVMKQNPLKFSWKISGDFLANFFPLSESHPTLDKSECGPDLESCYDLLW